MSRQTDSINLATNEIDDTADTQRREAVKTLGKFAAAAPVMVSLLVSSRSSASSHIGGGGGEGGEPSV